MTQYKIKQSSIEAEKGQLTFSAGFGGKKIHVMRLSKWSIDNGDLNDWASVCGAGTVAVISSRTRFMQESFHGVSTAESVLSDHLCARCIKKGYVEVVA